MNTARPAAIAMTTRRRCRCAGRGFSLIETLIAGTLMGILASVALPSLEGSLQRARRSDALVAVMQAQLAQERFRADNASYGTLGQIGQAGISALGHYTLRVAANSVAGYEVVASATGLQARDSLCRHLRLIVDGGTLTYTSGNDSSTSNAAPTNRRCWNQ